MKKPEKLLYGRDLNDEYVRGANNMWDKREAWLKKVASVKKIEKTIKEIADIKYIPMSGDYAMCYLHPLAMGISKSILDKINKTIIIYEEAEKINKRV